MTPDGFEQRLTKVPVRAAPAEWEAEILAAARKNARPQRKIVPIWPLLRSLLWPHPAAWAGVAAIWMAILFLNLSGPRGEYLLTSKRPVVPFDPVAMEAEIRGLRVRNEMIALWTRETDLPSRNRL